jgi:hypothetical protein
MKIFISHSHADQRIAIALLHYLLAEFELKAEDIRCTSVPGYQIPAGDFIVHRLRKDIKQGLGFIALLSHFGLESLWVKFELGAAWVTKKEVIPILGPGLSSADKQLGPIGSMPCVSIDDKQCKEILKQYFSQMAGSLNISPKNSRTSSAKLQIFIDVYRQWGGTHADFSQALIKVVSPLPGSSVGEVTPVVFTVEQVPANGYIWIGVTVNGLRWLKETINPPVHQGQYTVEVVESSTHPKRGSICIIGVGPAGHARLSVWFETGRRTANWPGLTIADIPGAVELACIDGLTINP